MKKILTLILIGICILGMVGCGNYLDYQILVNKTNPIPNDYITNVSLIHVTNVYGDEIQIEEITYKAYADLTDALLKEEIEIGLDSCYRSIEEQQSIMDEFIELYGQDYAIKTVAQPGTSEHHTGLAIDIVLKVKDNWVVENDDMLKQTEIFSVIHSKLADYGFILRYPEGKEEITGYDYEPWHLRYVGKEAAQKIFNDNITLEEYRNKIKQ